MKAEKSATSLAILGRPRPSQYHHIAEHANIFKKIFSYILFTTLFVSSCCNLKLSQYHHIPKHTNIFHCVYNLICFKLFPIFTFHVFILTVAAGIWKFWSEKLNLGSEMGFQGCFQIIGFGQIHFAIWTNTCFQTKQIQFSFVQIHLGAKSQFRSEMSFQVCLLNPPAVNGWYHGTLFLSPSIWDNLLANLANHLLIVKTGT